MSFSSSGSVTLESPSSTLMGLAEVSSRAEIVFSWLETPLGQMVAGCTEQGICLLEFGDSHFKSVQRRHARKLVEGEHRHLELVQAELADYFAGKLQRFAVKTAARGTPFQERVWAELARIPHGQTCSYEAIAQRIGQPTAVRAVARANALNPVCLLIPCHRVIAKDGSLSGYAGGVWRKRDLLDLERTGLLPQGRGAV